MLHQWPPVCQPECLRRVELNINLNINNPYYRKKIWTGKLHWQILKFCHDVAIGVGLYLAFGMGNFLYFRSVSLSPILTYNQLYSYFFIQDMHENSHVHDFLNKKGHSHTNKFSFKIYLLNNVFLNIFFSFFQKYSFETLYICRLC